MEGKRDRSDEKGKEREKEANRDRKAKREGKERNRPQEHERRMTECARRHTKTLNAGERKTQS